MVDTVRGTYHFAQVVCSIVCIDSYIGFISLHPRVSIVHSYSSTKEETNSYRMHDGEVQSLNDQSSGTEKPTLKDVLRKLSQATSSFFLLH